MTSRDKRQRAVPGSGAPAVNVPGFWNSLPSWILKGRAAFAAYVRTSLSAANTPAHMSCLWPCPVPYPEVFSRGPRGVRGWRKVQVSLMILLLSWLHLGCPVECPPHCRLGARPSARQWRMVRIMEGLSWDSDFSMPIDASEMGRATLLERGGPTSPPCHLVPHCHVVFFFRLHPGLQRQL